MKAVRFAIVVFFCLTQISYSQESEVTSLALPVRNSLTFNRFVINPTFSFVREQHKYISVFNKREWVQFEDAPQTYLASYNGRFGENIGAGIGLFQQNFGVFTTFGGVANFAYNARLDRDSNLTFGVNVGAYKSGLNTGNVVANRQSEDPALNNLPSSTVLLVNPGINYGTTFLDFGVSVNNLVVYNFEASELLTDNPEQGIQGHLMYTGFMSSGGFFDEAKFSGLVKSEFKQDETIISGLAMLSIPKGIWAQVGYNNLYGASGGIGLNITPTVSMEYSYEKAVGALADFGSSHEITLAYRFKNNDNYYYSGDEEVAGLFSDNNKKRRVSKNTKVKSSTATTGVDPIEAREKKLNAIAEAKKLRQAKTEEVQKKNAEKNKQREDAKIEALVKAEEEIIAKAETDIKLREEVKANAIAEEKKTIELAEAQAREKVRAILKAREEAKQLADTQEEQKTEQIAKKAAEAKARKEAAALAAKQEAEAQAEAKLEAERLAKEVAEAKARKEAAALAAKQEAEAQAETKLETERLAKEAAEAKARKEAAALAAKQEAEAQAKAKLEAERIAKEAVEEAARKEAEARARAEVKAKLEAKQLAKETEKADAAAQEQANAEAELFAKAEADLKAREKAQAKTSEFDKLVSEPTDAIGKSIKALTSASNASSTSQADLLKQLDKAVAVKDNDLKNLKEENDLGDQGIFKAPQPFKSITAENQALEAIKSSLDGIIKSRNDKLKELESLYDKEYEAGTITNDAVMLYYKKKIDKLKTQQATALRTRQTLVSKLKTIRAGLDYERKRRIKRASFNNEEDRYKQDRAALKTIKQNTTLSQIPLRNEDFDFGEAQSGSIQILKNVKNVNNGYYVIVAVHASKAKRDEFLRKAVASGRNDINFFYDVNTSRYYIYYIKADSVKNANEAMKQQANKPYNSNVSIIKIEN